MKLFDGDCNTHASPLSRSFVSLLNANRFVRVPSFLSARRVSTFCLVEPPETILHSRSRENEENYSAESLACRGVTAHCRDQQELHKYTECIKSSEFPFIYKFLYIYIYNASEIIGFFTLILS